MGSRLPLFPEQASSVAADVDHLTLFLLAVAIFFTILIFASIFYFAIRYRRRSEFEVPARLPSPSNQTSGMATKVRS